jgi:hypothetical protein
MSTPRLTGLRANNRFEVYEVVACTYSADSTLRLFYNSLNMTENFLARLLNLTESKGFLISAPFGFRSIEHGRTHRSARRHSDHDGQRRA